MMTALPSNAFAAGTLAGTAITNKAIVNYNAGSSARKDSAAVTLHVAHKVVASFTPASGRQTGVDDLTINVPIQFAQTGNRWDSFTIGVAKTGANAASYTVSMMDSVNGSVIANTSYMQHDTYRSMQLKIIAGAGIADTDSLNVLVTLTSQAANSGTDTIMAVGNITTYTYNFVYRVYRPNLVFSVSRLTNYATNANKIPGTAGTYQVSVQNTGSAAPTSNALINWQYSTTNYPYTSTTGTAGTDSAGGWKQFVLTPAQLPALMGAPVIFNTVFTIDQTANAGTGVSSGTAVAVNNPATAKIYVKYGHGAINKWFNAGGGVLDFNVGIASGASWSATPGNSNGNPGDSVQYSFTLKNTGNHADNYLLTNVLNTGLDQAHQFYTALPGAAITTLSTTLGAGLTQVLIVRCPVPVGATDAQTVGRNIIATTTTASPDPPTGGTIAASYTAPLTTTVKAPLLVVTISDTKISGLGTAANPAPGDVIQWTVTIKNNGTGNATAISSSNTGFAHTGTNIYNTNSVDVDPAGTNAWPNTGLDNGGTFTGPPSGTIAIGSGIITVTFSQIALGGAQVQYRYTVTVQ
jgi:uncharacterized repeat protein (TIGR01451 family)